MFFEYPDIETIYLLLHLVVAAFLIYIPFVCYWDIKSREVNPLYWIPLLVVCIPITAYFYLVDVYPLYSLWISCVMIAVFYLAMHSGYLEGADYLFLCFISLFWVVNPFPWTHGIMQIPFYLYFAFTTALSALYVFGYNIYKGNRWDTVSMFCTYPRGVPYMITISMAFLLSVMLG